MLPTELGMSIELFWCFAFFCSLWGWECFLEHLGPGVFLENLRLQLVLGKSYAVFCLGLGCFLETWLLFLCFSGPQAVNTAAKFRFQ